ncbi:MAG TPA: hypothetical protein PKH25_07690, partial [Syntrophales bacterium]|nr:hypothetical protein [Syntrophales bacterium]
VLRVQSVRSWTTAVAAIRPSAMGRGRPIACRRVRMSAQAAPTSSVTGEVIRDLYLSDVCMVRHHHRHG